MRIDKDKDKLVNESQTEEDIVGPTETEIDHVEKDIEKDKIDLQEVNKKLLADMENLRKRFEEEKMFFIKYRSASFLIEVLPTLDMFEIALNAEASEEVRIWLKGFEMVYSNLMNALTSEGMKKIKVNIGDEFDSNIHQGVETEENKNVESGKISRVVLSGYKLHDRLLRPVTVVVVK